MRKILLLSFLLISLFALCATADKYTGSGTYINLDTKGELNTTYQTSSSIVYGFNISANISSGYTCYLYTNENESYGKGDFRNVETMSGVANSTNYNFSTRVGIAEVVGYGYNYSVYCLSSESKYNWSSGSNRNVSFGVDTTSPTVTVNGPSNNYWYNSNTTIVLNLTVEDYNPSVCRLDTTINYSNAPKRFIYSTFNRGFDNVTSITNGTWFNFTKVNSTTRQSSGPYNFTESNSAANYIWYYICNDTAGHSTTATANYTFFVDVTPPSAFTFDITQFLTSGKRQLYNSTNQRCTDYTPQLGWGTTTESNFSRYEIFFYNTTSGTGNFIRKNISSITENSTNMSTLWGDLNYYINISAYDEAGNRISMTSADSNGYQYQTTSTGRSLDAGWNIVSNMGSPTTLSAILNWSGATTVSIWNYSHRFVSHVSGGSNGGEAAKYGDPVLVYVSADTDYSDSIWNITYYTGDNRSSNLTNFSVAQGFASGWNLVVNRNYSDSVAFWNLDNATNRCILEAKCDTTANSSYFSYFNNSASSGYKYIPYVSNWTINNRTLIKSGESVWMYISKTGLDRLILNWSTMPIR